MEAKDWKRSLLLLRKSGVPEDKIKKLLGTGPETATISIDKVERLVDEKGNPASGKYEDAVNQITIDKGREREEGGKAGAGYALTLGHELLHPIQAQETPIRKRILNSLGKNVKTEEGYTTVFGHSEDRADQPPNLLNMRKSGSTHKDLAEKLGGSRKLNFDKTKEEMNKDSRDIDVRIAEGIGLIKPLKKVEDFVDTDKLNSKITERDVAQKVTENQLKDIEKVAKIKRKKKG